MTAVEKFMSPSVKQMIYALILSVIALEAYAVDATELVRQYINDSADRIERRSIIAKNEKEEIRAELEKRSDLTKNYVAGCRALQNAKIGDKSSQNLHSKLKEKLKLNNDFIDTKVRSIRGLYEVADASAKRACTNPESSSLSLDQITLAAIKCAYKQEIVAKIKINFESAEFIKLSNDYSNQNLEPLLGCIGKKKIDYETIKKYEKLVQYIGQISEIQLGTLSEMAMVDMNTDMNINHE